MSETLQKNISPFIEQQFPGVYKENGPAFIAFVTEYYKWLEANDNVTYHARHMPEYEDIDDTLDAFVNHFRFKYLTNIQLDTVQSTRTLVKHSLDLYRSKSSERSLKLLFRAAFGIGAEVKYPGDDLFKTSDGKWFRPTYLEVNLDSGNGIYSGKQIVGLNSKATAFVETVVRRKIKNRQSDILYISNIAGRFQTGEQLLIAGTTVNSNYRATVVGSLNAITVSTSGSGVNFNIGDIVDVTSDNGYEAKALVSNTISQSGLLNFQLFEGGYGYNSNSTVLLSTKNLTIQNVAANSILLETVTQPLANLHYLNATGFFNKGDLINGYWANNLLRGSSLVLSTVQSNSSAGYMLVEVLSGNINSNTIYSSGNVVAANLSIIDGFTDKTASGTVVGYNHGLDGSIKIGVANISNQFLTNSHIFSSNSSVAGLLYSVSSGTGGTMAISNNLLYAETVNINTDLLSGYINVQLNASTFGFVAHPSANISANMAYAFSSPNNTFGKIQTLIGINPGTGYNDIPFLTVIEPFTASFNKFDYLMTIANTNSNFTIGEVVTQASTNGRALVLDANSTYLRLQNLRVDPNNWLKVDGTTVVGSSSSANAIPTFMADDLNSIIMGENAKITVGVNSGNGSVTALSIVASGFGFNDQEQVTFTKGLSSGQGFANVNYQGTASGYYKRLGGRTSSEKKLFDGYYYQEFSYDVVSSLQLDKYAEALKNVVHAAGYIFFGTFEHDSVGSITENLIATEIGYPIIPATTNYADPSVSGLIVLVGI